MRDGNISEEVTRVKGTKSEADGVTEKGVSERKAGRGIEGTGQVEEGVSQQHKGHKCPKCVGKKYPRCFGRSAPSLWEEDCFA